MEASSQEQQSEATLGGTARFIPTPLEDQPQSQPFRQSHKHEDDDEDPFQQHSNAAVAYQHQQRTLSANSVDISHSMRAGASGSFASTVVDQRQLTRNSSWEEEKEFSTTMPLARTPSMGALHSTAQQQQSTSTLADLPSSVLKQKASQITALIAQFDAQFLRPHEQSSQQLIYPHWALPFVREMSVKLSTIMQAQHAAEEREEEAEEDRMWEQGSKKAQAESQQRRQREREERQNQRKREAQASQEKVRSIEQQHQQLSNRQFQQQHLSATTISPPRRIRPQQQVSPSQHGTAGFYPPSLYTVDPNASLPFLRDHGVFDQRKESVRDDRASARRNLGHAGEKTMTYYSGAGSSPQQQLVGRGRRPTSAKSAAYLTQLMGHDMNATMMNRFMRATSRSPSPPRRQQYRPAPAQSTMPNKELPGPTIPRAQRFSAYSTSAPLDSGMSAQRARAAEAAERRRQRERAREMELAALKIQVSDLLDQMRASFSEQKERREEERHEKERSREREERQRRKEKERRARDRERNAEHESNSHTLQQHQQARSVSPPSPPRRRRERSRSRSHSPSSGFDEDALASALIRIGESNRSKFSVLIEQITRLQEVMVRQQEKLEGMAGGGGAGGALSHLGAFASYDPSNPQGSFERERSLAQQMHSEMEHLQRELQEAMREKEKLAAQVKEMAAHQERHKFDLLEKVTDLSLQQTDLNQARTRDRTLLKSYENDLRASREAISALQEMLARESTHSTAAQEEKRRLEKKMEDLEKRIREKEELEKDAAYAAGKGKLKPAARFQSFMHKYLASFYRREFQQLLAERSKNLSAADRAQAEVQRAHEKHQLELEYTHRTHSAILAHVTETQGSSSDAAQKMRDDMEKMREHTEQLEREREQREIDLRATEMLAQDLADKLSAKEGGYSGAGSSEGGVPAFASDFTDLMRASFKGDYLAARNDTAMLRAVHAVGDEHILFSDYVQRVDRHNKYQKRILLITDAHVLCLWADRGRPVRRVIQILAIRHISLSRQSADMFVLHYADEYDYLIISSKRSEIMYHLLTQTNSLSSGTKTLTYRFGERVYVRDRDHKHRDIHVTASHVDGMNKIVLGSSTIRPLSMVDEEDGHLLAP